ncbi:hypothetical protein ACETIH_07070 [Microvirga arabica]|uniref:Uncharacterized protein n=1 Tax=Microvirga arabica TaxID=1128671 RepID=A0ABV6Y5L4_9HYPH
MSEEILETGCHSRDAIFVPPHAPMRVLEVLKGPAGAKPMSAVSTEMPEAA